MAKPNIPQLIEDLQDGVPLATDLLKIMFFNLGDDISEELFTFANPAIEDYYKSLFVEPIEYTHTNVDLYKAMRSSKRLAHLSKEEKEYLLIQLLENPEIDSYYQDPVEVLMGMMEDEDNGEYQPPRKEDYTPVK